MISFSLNRDILRGLGKNFANVRLSLNLTQREVARRSGVPLATLRRFETTGQIGTKALVELAAVVQRKGDLETIFYRAPEIIKQIIKPRLRARKKVVGAKWL